MNAGSRRAKLSDLEKLLSIERGAPVDREWTEQLSERVHSGEVIVFENGDQVVGFVVVRRKTFFANDFVELMIVSDGHRRQGIGSALLNEAVTHSSSDRVFTSTNQSNAAMIAMVAKTGWHLSGQLEGIDEADPELIFYKDVL